ncbi:MAG TPA: permease, partial [Myxococcota bacterium]
VAVVEDELHFVATFFTMAAESAPALLVSFVVLGAMGAFGHRFKGVLRGRGPRAWQAFTGVVAGLPVPLCSCTVGAVFERIMRRRVGVAAAVALLVSVPEIALPSLALSTELLGPSLTIARLLGAVVVAVVAGVVVGIFAADVDSAEAGTLDDTPQPFLASLLSSVDHVLPWVLLGLVLAAFCEPLLSTTALSGMPRLLEVPAYGLLGVPFYICATGSTPLVAVLVHKGASAGAVVAFLLAAPATNLATLGVVTRLLSTRVAFAFAAAVYGAAVVVGFGIDAAVDVGVITLPSLHADHAHAHGVVELGALAAVVALLVVSLVRQGARGFLGQILRSLDDAKGGHVHGPHCGHAGFARPGFVKKAPVARVKVDFVRANERNSEHHPT